MDSGRWVSRLVLPGGLLILGCSVIERQLPTQPSGSPGPTLPPIAIPVILPKPAPTPTPAATPAPTPTPAPPPNGGSCSLPPSNPENPTCTDGGARLYGSVDAALTQVTLSRPDLFDFNDRKCDNCYLVKDVDGYVAEVQKYLSAEGICTFWDGEELAAKETNDYSEQYDILLASGHMRRGVGSYRGVCRPSWF